MSLYDPMPQIKELNFRMYITNLFCAVKGLHPFEGDDKEQKRKERLDVFCSRIKKILGHQKSVMGAGEYIFLGEKEQILQRFCDEIMEILFKRKNDLKNMKISGDNDYLLFLDKFFAFLLFEENLPRLVNLIFHMISGGTIFSKEGDDEKAREWMDSYERRLLL